MSKLQNSIVIDCGDKKMSQKIRFLTTSLILAFCAGCVVNPITGQEEFIIMAESQDVAIGKKYAPELEKQMGGRIADAALQNYINTIGQKVAKVSHRRTWDYHFVALDISSSQRACSRN